MITCPCGKHQIDENAKICPYCGILIKIGNIGIETTRALGGETEEESVSRWGTAYFNTRMVLMMRVRGETNAIMLPADEITNGIIGRNDPSLPQPPQIDLTPYRAEELGVSRRHARIERRENNVLNLTDLDSANGTYLNGTRMIPGQSRIVRNGDEIRLGKLVMTIEFMRQQPAAAQPPPPSEPQTPSAPPKPAPPTDRL